MKILFFIKWFQYEIFAIQSYLIFPYRQSIQETIKKKHEIASFGEFLKKVTTRQDFSDNGNKEENSYGDKCVSGKCSKDKFSDSYVEAYKTKLIPDRRKHVRM